MSTKERTTAKTTSAQRWKQILFSPTLADKNGSHRIAYIAVVAALLVICNMFFEIKLGNTQFSLTIFFSALAGILIGPLFGFAACFLGDLVGFLYNPFGSYSPWIGLSMGLIALFSGLIVGGIPKKTTWFLYVKLTVVCLLTFAVCTVAINTTALWLLLWYPSLGFWEYFLQRFLVEGQVWNSLVNSVLLFIAVPLLNRIKPLKIHIR